MFIDYSRKITVYCLQSKDEIAEYTLGYIRKCIVRVERETDRKVKSEKI